MIFIFLFLKIEEEIFQNHYFHVAFAALKKIHQDVKISPQLFFVG
jgi:hypothetical protein